MDFFLKRPCLLCPMHVWAQLEEGTEWTLPNLRQLGLRDVKTYHITVNYVPPTGVGVDSSGEVHQISVDWKDKHQSRTNWDPRYHGIVLQLSKEKVFSLDAKDGATKLRIVAPLATKMHLKGCGALKELDFDCPLLLDLGVRNATSTIQKMVESFSKKSPWLKLVTLEMWQVTIRHNIREI